MVDSGTQQREQFVGRLELALAKARRHNRFNGLQLFGGIGPNVDFRRGQVTVPQPQGDLRMSFVACSIFDLPFWCDAAERTQLPTG
jgi:hypothetical protein